MAMLSDDQSNISSTKNQYPELPYGQAPADLLVPVIF
jgi:hypothetical protein